MPYAWIEYKVNTNTSTWTTTEWQAVDVAVPQASITGTDDGHNYTYSSAHGHGSDPCANYSIDGNGNFVLSNEINALVPAGHTMSVNGWVYFGGDKKHIQLLTSVTADGWYWHGHGDHEKSVTPYTEYYGRALTTSSRTVPHSSTSTAVDWNTVVKIHLTEQTGEQFKRYPLVE